MVDCGRWETKTPVFFGPVECGACLGSRAEAAGVTDGVEDDALDPAVADVAEAVLEAEAADVLEV